MPVRVNGCLNAGRASAHAMLRPGHCGWSRACDLACPPSNQFIIIIAFGSCLRTCHTSDSISLARVTGDFSLGVPKEKTRKKREKRKREENQRRRRKGERRGRGGVY